MIETITAYVKRWNEMTPDERNEETALLAGWVRVTRSTWNDPNGQCDFVPEFTTDWREAGEALEKLGPGCMVGRRPDGTWVARDASMAETVLANPGLCGVFFGYEQPTAPLAICLAHNIKAKLEKGELVSG
jgi:hypothetical protein